MSSPTDFYHDELEEADKAVRGLSGPSLTTTHLDKTIQTKAFPCNLQSPLFAAPSLPTHEEVNCPRKVTLDRTNADVVFDFMVEFLRNSQHSDFKEYQQEKSIRGYTWEDSKFGKYKMQLYSEEGKIGVACHLVDGFAPSLNNMWNGFTGELRKEQFYTDEEMDDMEEMSDWELEEDSEFESLDNEGLQLGNKMQGFDLFKYLNLEEDPAVLERMIEDLRHPKYRTNTMLLLAHNAAVPSNRQVMQAYAQQLVNQVTALLLVHAMSLPIVRSAAVLVNHLATVGNFELKEEQLTAIIKAFLQWSVGLEKQTQDQDVFASENTTEEFARALPNLINYVQGNLDVSKQAEKMTKIPQCFPENQNIKSQVDMVLQTLGQRC